MATQDISRSASDFRKHYHGVHLQQGRVFYEDDWNDAERLAREDRREEIVEIVGPAGSPDGGFRIADAEITAGGEVDFEIGAGALYVGGLRLELEEPERFRSQADWLSQPPAARQAPAGERTDLVYVLCWEQPVAAVEDSELFEVALGGPDTSTRLRTMARVGVLADVGTDDCSEAWGDLVDAWGGAAGVGTLTDEHELVPDTRLTVGFDPGGDPSDLCTPLAAGGYLGAENQAIRVQLVDGNRFTWGFDNASALYRVQVAADATTVTLLTEPKDHLHWPLAGQIVEILPWGAVLPNGEKLAEGSGHLSRVAGSYDPDTRQLVLATGLPAGFGTEWQAREDAGDLGPAFFYLRVWDRGADTTSDAAISFTAGTPVSLAGTGLTVEIDGADARAGDHWVIAARPQTPNRVVPWALETGRAPDGVRLFAAPLALVRWPDGAAGTVGEVVHDCREPFRPLTRLRTCCTYTVGDGTRSHGDFASVQEAIDALPESGGEVCVLPGRYEETVAIENRRNVTVRGCGRRSTLRAPEGSTDPVIAIRDSAGITLDSLAIEAEAGVGVELAEGKGRLLNRVSLTRLQITARDRSAVRAGGGRWIELVDSMIFCAPLAENLAAGLTAGTEAAVSLTSDDVLVERNWIAADSEDRLVAPAGGVHIGGGSDRVVLRRNRIVGGNGHGVTLGTVAYVTPEARAAAEDDYEAFVASVQVYQGTTRFTVDEGGCVIIDPEPEPPVDENGDPLVPVSAGALSDVSILENEIAEMGGDGIGVVRFFDLAENPDFVTVERLTIRENRIERCLRLEPARLPARLRDVAGHGGIALADCDDLVIEDNLIAANGRSHLDPACGVFVLQGEGIAIERNRILENGPRVEGDETPRPGFRGGIVIALAAAPLLTPADEDVRLPLTSGYPACRVHGNVVVVPEGRALQLVALGPVAVEGNQLVSRGTTALAALFRTVVSELGGEGEDSETAPRRTFVDFLGGAAVSILELGISMEIYGQASGFSTMSSVHTTSSQYGRESAFTPGLLGSGGLFRSGLDPGRRLAGGQVLFNDNQVSLDLREAERSGTLSSVLVLSLDDVSFHGNQCECDLLADFVLTNALVLAWSVRMADNRFQEGAQVAYLSAVTLGMLNSTTDNQGTHCILAAGHPNLTEREHNRSLVEMAARDGSVCERLGGLASGVGRFLFAGGARMTQEVIR